MADTNLPGHERLRVAGTSQVACRVHGLSWDCCMELPSMHVQAQPPPSMHVPPSSATSQHARPSSATSQHARPSKLSHLPACTSPPRLSKLSSKLTSLDTGSRLPSSSRQRNMGSVQAMLSLFLPFSPSTVHSFRETEHPMQHGSMHSVPDGFDPSSLLPTPRRLPTLAPFRIQLRTPCGSRLLPDSSRSCLSQALHTGSAGGPDSTSPGHRRLRSPPRTLLRPVLVFPGCLIPAPSRRWRAPRLDSPVPGLSGGSAWPPSTFPASPRAGSVDRSRLSFVPASPPSRPPASCRPRQPTSGRPPSSMPPVSQAFRVLAIHTLLQSATAAQVPLAAATCSDETAPVALTVH